MTDRAIHWVRDVLDHEIVDAHQTPCGMVDDIEVELVPGRGLRPMALLVGPGAWQRRLPSWMARVARMIAGDSIVRVPWSAIAHIDERVALRGTADEWGLGEADRRWSKRFAPLVRE